MTNNILVLFYSNLNNSLQITIGRYFSLKSVIGASTTSSAFYLYYRLFRLREIHIKTVHVCHIVFRRARFCVPNVNFLVALKTLSSTNLMLEDLDFRNEWLDVSSFKAHFLKKTGFWTFSLLLAFWFETNRCTGTNLLNEVSRTS